MLVSATVKRVRRRKFGLSRSFDLATIKVFFFFFCSSSGMPFISFCQLAFYSPLTCELLNEGKKVSAIKSFSKALLRVDNRSVSWKLWVTLGKKSWYFLWNKKLWLYNLLVKIWQRQTAAYKWYLLMHLLAELFAFWGWSWAFFFWKRESRLHSINVANFFLSSHL